MNTLTLNISDELREQLQTLAKEKQRRVNELAIEAIRKYVAIEELQELRRRTIPYAQARGFLNDDDVFREVS